MEIGDIVICLLGGDKRYLQLGVIVDTHNGQFPFFSAYVKYSDDEIVEYSIYTIKGGFKKVTTTLIIDL